VTSHDAIVSGHADPEGEAPWAMQLVIRIDKADPPTRTAICEAAATAVVRLLTAPEAAGEWEPAIARWTDGSIRKHARRASRPAAWAKVADLPGVTVEHGGARVRAFVPTATDAIPKDVATLQLSGTEAEDPDRRTRRVEPVPVGVLVVTLSPDAEMPLGKAAAAAGHAAQIAFSAMLADSRDLWAGNGFPVVIEQPDSEDWPAFVDDAQVRVVDAGLTVVAPGTITAVARWA
jgi:peptidyl-tRNA hydrolase